MDGDEIDRVDQLRIAQPDMPWLGRGHRHRDLLANLAQIAGERFGREQTVQDRLVAHDQALDIAVVEGRPDQRGDLLLIVVQPGVQPGPQRELDAIGLGDCGQVRQFARAVGSDLAGDLGEHRHVGGDVQRTWITAFERAVPALIGVIGQPVDDPAMRRWGDRRMGDPPDRQIQQHHAQCQGERPSPVPSTRPALAGGIENGRATAPQREVSDETVTMIVFHVAASQHERPPNSGGTTKRCDARRRRQDVVVRDPPRR
ncbi:MAG: hypothetical protein R3E83_16060 [Burkholderiaceae bacterium]